MRLKLTLVRPNGAASDIIVTADAAATISEIAGTISRVDAQTVHSPDRYLTLRATLPGQSVPLTLPPDGPVGEAWIGSGASVSLADAGVLYQAPSTITVPPVAQLRVLTGPDAGRDFPLAPGSLVLGRDPSCDIVLHDSLVSKKHARLEIGDTVEVIDLGSANGVVVDGGIVGRLRIAKAERLLLGDSEVEISLLTDAPSPESAPKPGPIFFNRSPKVEKRYLGQEFISPEVPTEKEDAPFPLLAMLTPLLLGGAMFALTKSPTTLLFCLLSPVMLIGNFLTTKTRDKRRMAKAVAKFSSRLEVLTARLATERVIEHELRLKESPSTLEAHEHAMNRGPMLWTRRPEHWSFLNVRLGCGTMNSRNTISDSSRGDMLPKFEEKLTEVVNANRTLDGVPLIDNLYDSGALGIAGSPAQAMGSINSILVQLTALHSPAELVVASLVTPRWSRELEWLKWIPHTSSPHSPIEGSHLADSAASASAVLSGIEGVVEQRLAQAKSKRRGAMVQTDAALERGGEVGGSGTHEGTKSAIPAIVLLISDDVAIDRARLVQLAEIAADAGVYPIWIGPTVAALPAVCRTYLHLGDEPGIATVGFVRLGETIDNVATEQVDSATALEFAKRMAPVIDAGALVADASDLPRTVSLVTLLGHDMVETSAAVIDRWQQNTSIHDRSGGTPKPRRAGKLRAIIGSAGVDAMHLDLRTQGPHALVGGTTGAGKSEFLQAWVLGMAAAHSPDRVTFLFVDY